MFFFGRAITSLSPGAWSPPLPILVQTDQGGGLSSFPQRSIFSFWHRVFFVFLTNICLKRPILRVRNCRSGTSPQASNQSPGPRHCLGVPPPPPDTHGPEGGSTQPPPLLHGELCSGPHLPLKPIATSQWAQHPSLAASSPGGGRAHRGGARCGEPRHGGDHQGHCCRPTFTPCFVPLQAGALANISNVAPPRCFVFHTQGECLLQHGFFVHFCLCGDFIQSVHCVHFVFVSPLFFS